MLLQLRAKKLYLQLGGTLFVAGGVKILPLEEIFGMWE